MRTFLLGFTTAGVLVSVFSCMTVPISGRKAFNLIPEGLEKSLGAQSYRSVLAKERISTDTRLSTIVTRAGQRIAAVAEKPDYEWEFKLIESNTQNAFCLPGGKIAIYRGILPIARNEAGLATVMAHEIVHAIARHGGQRMSTGIVSAGGLAALQQTALKDNKNAPYIMAALGAGVAIGYVLPHSRGNETEADEVGQTLMARAGYDPSESIQFWHRFGEVTKGGSMPGFLSTHPSSASREENMRKLLPSAQAEYAKAPQKLGLGETF